LKGFASSRRGGGIFIDAMSNVETGLADRQSSIERAWQAVANPTDAARTASRYAARSETGELIRLLDTSQAIFEHVAHGAFRNFVAAEKFPCVGAKSALNRNAYRFGAYESLTDPSSSAGLARDLVAFSNESDALAGDFSTFVSVFRERDSIESEAGFEAALWGQLQRLHDLDAGIHAWDPAVSSDPSDPHFSFSIAGKAYFVVGLHPLASRSARRFAWPALVFNPHEQFQRLRDSGNFERFRDRIRERDIALDGSLNPNVVDFGTLSETRQYSGRPVEADWQCPFRANVT
jgi:FPC/CPF motif-containing protein YcgG